MCKSCQYCFESCYWHCCEKHFCLDDDIVFYKDPDDTKNEPNNNAFDNLAFYDNVALIANRSIFTIEPLPPKYQHPVIVQPKKKTLRWFENEEEQNRSNERRSTINRKMSVVPEEDQDAISVDTLDGVKADKNHNENIEETKENTNREKEIKDNNNSKTIESIYKENKEEEEEYVVTSRKKPLQQRRMSKGLTLKIDRAELPIIRQSSVPKFFMDTPEENQLEATVARTPSIALSAPIKPHQFKFDLKSVVQIHKDTTPPEQEQTKNKRVTSFKEKILKRQHSNLSTTTLQRQSSNLSSSGIISVHL